MAGARDWRLYRGLDSRTITVLRAMTTRPARGFVRKLDYFMRGATAAGILARYDVLWLNIDSASASVINLVDTANNLTATHPSGGVGAPTWSAAGWTGDGVDDVLTTGLNLSASTKFTQDDHSAFVFSVTDLALDMADYGQDTAAINTRSAANEIRIRSSSTTTDTVAIVNGSGLTAFNRTGSTGFDIYKNGAKLGATKTRASAAITLQNDWFCAFNSSGTRQYSTRTLCAGGRGASLTAAQHAELYRLLLVFFAGSASLPQPNGLWTGGLTDSSVEISFDMTSPADAAQAVVSTSSTDFSAPVASTTSAASVVKGATNIHTGSLTGLTANTVYYAAPKVNGAVDATKAVRFKTAPTKWARAAFDWTHTSCLRTTANVETLSHEKIASLVPLFNVILGDAGYSDTTYGSERSTSSDTWRAFYRAYRDNVSVKAMHAVCPEEMEPDDHDYWGGNNNSTLTSGQPAGGVISRGALNEIRPHHPFVQTGLGEATTSKLLGTRYFDIATTRFLVLDTRTQRVPGVTMLGNSTSALYWDQKTWLLNTFIPLCATDAGLGRIDNVVLMSPTGVPGVYDGWKSDAAWLAEFDAIEAAILAQSGMPRTFWATGDDHNTMVESGETGQTTGRLPIIRSSPVVNNSDLDASVAGYWNALPTSVYYNHRMFIRWRIDANAEITFEVYGKQDIAVSASPIVLLATYATTDRTPVVTFTSAVSGTALTTINLPWTRDWLSRAGGSSCSYSTSWGISGTLSQDANPRSGANMIQLPADAGSYTITLSSPVRCTLGVTTITVTVSASASSALLLEGSGALLLENGNYLLLEA